MLVQFIYSIDFSYTGDIRELEVLLKGCDKKKLPPILIFILGEPTKGHEPKDYLPYLKDLETPWMVS